VNNLIAACRFIINLNCIFYNFFYLSIWFIAHYNIDGFKAHYSEPGSLQADIEANARNNQWHNFRKGERDADYYHSKRDTYNAILGRFCATQYFRDHVIFIRVGDPA